MTALDYILDGLEAALELERELGARAVPCDRGLLAPIASVRPMEATVSSSRPEASGVPVARHEPRRPAADPASDAGRPVRPAAAGGGRRRELIFLHDRPLSPQGVEMMAKIVTAMGRTAEDAPIVFAPPVPDAKVIVVLGGRALKMHFPGVKGEPGRWFKSAKGRDVLVTYSPEYILRFETVTPAVKQIKADMWRSLKAVNQRLGA